MKYWIECDYHEEVGCDNREFESKWDGFSHTVRTGHTFKVYNKKIDYPDYSFDTDIEDPHVVIVLYYDGGTFGRTEGYVQYLPPSTKEESEQYAKMILNKKPLNMGFYEYWYGYFSGLQKVGILRMDGYIKWY